MFTVLFSPGGGNIPLLRSWQYKVFSYIAVVAIWPAHRLYFTFRFIGIQGVGATRGRRADSSPCGQDRRFPLVSVHYYSLSLTGGDGRSMLLQA